jgi:hypothetical protein
MQFLTKAIISISGVSVACQAFSAPPADETFPPPIAVDTYVINDESSPVPVSGDVSVTGEVDLGGAVDVGSVPESLTQQLDTLIDEVKALKDEVGDVDTQAKPANYFKSFQNTGFGGTWEVDLDVPVQVSFITISAENDSGKAVFFSPYDGVGPLRFGSYGKEFPAVLVAPLPQPVLIDKFTFYCSNTVENCEVSVTLVGTMTQ